MKTITRSVLVPRPAQRMYELVDDVERYPEFLPWCAGTQVFERTGALTRARIDIDYHGLKSHVATVNRNQPPERIDLEFLEGPFRTFRGHWRFTPLAADGSRVEFSLEFAFSSPSVEAVLAPVFGHIMETLVDRFVARAEST